MAPATNTVSPATKIPLSVYQSLVPPPKYPRKPVNGHYESRGPCPLCPEGGDDRFSIWEDEQGRVVWQCTHCKPTGQDVFGDMLLRKMGRLDILSQYGIGEKWSPPPGWAAPVITKKAPEAPEPPRFADLVVKTSAMFKKAQVYHTEGIKEAMLHLEQYSITYKTAQQYMVGYAPRIDRADCSLPAGVTFPNISLGLNAATALRGLSVRRSDEACKKELLANGPEWIEQQQTLLLEKWLRQIDAGTRPPETLRVPTIQDLIDADPRWSKYKMFKGSEMGIWNDSLVTLPDNSRHGPHLPYIFITEGVRDALCLLQEGIPAVAYVDRADWRFWLPRVFKNVAGIYVVADRDTDWNNAGQGEKHADQIVQALDRGTSQIGYNVRMVLPPPGYDDISTLCKASGGMSAMIRWAIDMGTPPVLEPLY